VTQGEDTPTGGGQPFGERPAARRQAELHLTRAYQNPSGEGGETLGWCQSVSPEFEEKKPCSFTDQILYEGMHIEPVKKVQGLDLEERKIWSCGNKPKPPSLLGVQKRKIARGPIYHRCREGIPDH